MAKQVWKAEDGSIHENFSDAVTKDNELKSDDEKLYQKALNIYSVRELLKTYSLSHYGIWQVFGEDENTSPLSSSNQPYLGTYEGSLETVIRKAIKLPLFWYWGGGGSFKLINIEKV